MGWIRSMHWTHRGGDPSVAGEEGPMSEIHMSEILAHGAYLCLRRSGGGVVGSAGAARVAALAERLQLRNEFDPGWTPSRESIAFLRRHDATPGDIADDDLLQADWVIHVASKRQEAITTRSSFQ